jgi:hypothetical protein
MERVVHEGVVRNIALQTVDRDNGKEATDIMDKHTLPSGVTMDLVPHSGNGHNCSYIGVR